MQRAVLNHVPLHNSKYKQLRADPPPEVRRLAILLTLSECFVASAERRVAELD
jgi:hypothetical protein